MGIVQLGKASEVPGAQHSDLKFVNIDWWIILCQENLSSFTWKEMTEPLKLFGGMSEEWLVPDPG